MQRVLRIAVCLVWSAIVPVRGAPLARPYTVENYDVSIRVDLAKQRLYGESTIRLRGRGEIAVSALELDSGSLQIKSVLEDQLPQSFESNHGRLYVVMTRPVHPDEQRILTVKYEAAPAAGLKFFSDQVYTTAVSDWMPCDDSPGERATLHLVLTAPAETKAAASGQLIAARAGEGQNITEWQTDSPTDPFRFGFALGMFIENTSESDGVKLRVLGAGTPILEPTSVAMHFLAERTGKSYPGQSYTEVVVHGDATRSLAGLTLLPESIAQGIGKEPDQARVLAGQLAQQWFGVAITVRDWADLWLTAGIPAFLGDAFLEQRAGKETYEREMQRSRQAYYQLVSEGMDRPLSNSNWTTRQEADGEIPELKGAWFLYLLKQLVGDAAFWNGLKLYASNEWHQAATSEDFQRAFYAAGANGRNAGGKGAAAPRRNQPKSLDSLFDMWVYGVTSAAPGRKSR